MDEIWCFGFSRRIAEGYIPYRDYNIIITPLFFFIGALFSKSLAIYRLYGALVNAAIPVITYYYCEKNEIDKQLSIVITFINGFLILGLEANYNYLLLVGMMISYISANRFFNNKNEKNSLLFGLSLSILLLIKQNVPAILIVFFTCILCFLLLKQKISLKTFIFYALGGVTPVLILFIYLLINGSFIFFIDYTILGLNSFSNNFIFDKESLIAILPSLINTIIITINLFKKESDGLINYSTLIYSLASYIIVFPIVNLPHAIILLVFNIFLSIPLMKNIRLKLKLVKVLVCFIYIIILISGIIRKDKDYIRSEIQIYRNILIKKDVEENIKLISEYIKEQEEKGLDVSILNAYAYLYTIPANDNNGVLDLLSIGNVGTISNREILSRY